MVGLGESPRAQVLVVEDEVLVARAYRRALRPHVSVEIAHTAARARALLPSSDWLLLIVDVALPDGSGLDWLAWAREQGHHNEAIVFSAFQDVELVNRAFQLRARYLVKPCGLDTLLSYVGEVLDARNANVSQWTKRYGLTEAETELLALAMRGNAREEIAVERGTSPSTTKNQIRSLLSKTGDRSLALAVSRLLRERELDHVS